jgi:hypothetical protein
LNKRYGQGCNLTRSDVPVRPWDYGPNDTWSAFLGQVVECRREHIWQGWYCSYNDATLTQPCLFSARYLCLWGLYHCFVASDWLTVSLLGNLWQCGSDYLIFLMFKKGNPIENTQKPFIYCKRAAEKLRKKCANAIDRCYTYPGNSYPNICITSFHTNFQWIPLFVKTDDSDDPKGLNSVKTHTTQEIFYFILFWTVSKFFSRKINPNLSIAGISEILISQ